MRFHTWLAPCVVLLAGQGCSNALFFYETEKISLTLEARPDSNQPVQGSFGGKSRTVVVTPPRGNGEAGSMISSFRVRKEQGFLGAVTMQSALVTGAPSTNLEPEQAAEVAAAVTGAPILTTGEIAKAMMQNGLASDDPERFRTLIKKKCSELSGSERTELGKLTKHPLDYSPPLDECQYHNAIRKLFNYSEE